MRPASPAVVCLLALLAPNVAGAGEGPGTAENDGAAEVAGSGDVAVTDADVAVAGDTEVTDAAAAPAAELPWIRRYAPEANTGEIGVYGGLMLISADHELFGADTSMLPDQGFRPLRRLNPDLGVRLGYYPLRFFGVEAEAGAVPSRVDDGSRAVPFTVRAQVVGQLGRWSVTPFVLVGVGLLGIRSDRAVLGNDIDPALHFGGGVKLHINRRVLLRLDLRDVVSHRRGAAQTFEAHHFEALLGLAITLGRRPQAAATPAPSSAPGVGDRDGDGLRDDVDQCVDDPETINDFEDEDGCPESDRDGDGFWDPQDSCPDEAGVAPDGCPIRDSDGDGLFDDVDQCIDQPETDNGFEDEDGCPDELPEAVKRFTGSIQGITFENNQATIRRSSLPTLDEAVRILLQYPSLHIEISGHTDARGGREHNLDLSRRRAESVASYLAGMGVGEDRITTVGHGPDQPIDSNDTKAGRANNRRIEFRVLTGAEVRAQSTPAPEQPAAPEPTPDQP